eukprot:CAMPEP_0181387556 /NCGR_PEP_ID=MMETSP1106-20121128/23786_1 /TAXON_ID=81844 /ORGANISM="Mantoniella antarctica, Strain SL-175" /LENGTH=63 /DNA_ID=CAMNT_0023507951 /DNA_START=341 /DNA_END=533 /DNA_ORIENTATION=+
MTAAAAGAEVQGDASESRGAIASPAQLTSGGIGVQAAQDEVPGFGRDAVQRVKITVDQTLVID